MIIDILMGPCCFGCGLSKFAVLLSGLRRASIFFLRHAGLVQAEMLDGDGLDNKEGMNNAIYPRDERVTYKAVTIAKTAGRIVVVGLKACQLEAGRRVATFNIPGCAGLLAMGVSQYAMDFRR